MSTDELPPQPVIMDFRWKKLKRERDEARQVLMDLYSARSTRFPSMDGSQTIHFSRLPAKLWERWLIHAGIIEELEKKIEGSAPAEDCEHPWHYAHEDGTRCPVCEEKG